MRFVANGFPGFWAVYQAPVLAAVVAALAVLLRRATPGRWDAAAVGVAVGWALLVPLSALARALFAPRAPVDYLLLPSLVAMAAGLALPVLGARAARWAGVTVPVAVGWWLAGSPAGQREFWRVWAVVALAGVLLSRGVRTDPGRAVAAALALWGGLVAAGAPPVWIAAALVLAAAGAVLAAGSMALPPVLVVAAGAAASLGAGRLVRGGLNGVDLAALAALAAPLLAAALQSRAGRRLGRAGGVLVPAGAAALLALAVWCAVRITRT